MPVTAKLSRKFYDAMGDDVANELVDWFNAVDLTYRTDLRELNELNHSRFEAKLGEAASGLRADLERRIGQLRADMEGRFVELKTDMVEVRTEIERHRGETKRDIAEIRMATEAMGSQLRLEMAILRADLVKWMFLFWLGSIAGEPGATCSR